MFSTHEGLPEHATVCGVVLNDRASWEAMRPQFGQAPYQAAPKAPVMYVKPANTWVHDGATVELPYGASTLEIGTTVGVVIGKDASCVTVAKAMSHVRAYVLVADLSVPHSSYYRPAIQEKSFDRSCVFGTPVAASAVNDLSQTRLTTIIDGHDAERRDLDDLIRDVPTLLSDVSQFMTLKTGDVLLTGIKYQAAQAGAGSAVQVTSTHFGDIGFTLIATQGEAQ